MGKLILSDFRRVLKDKLFLVVCILAGVFALITPLLYSVLLSGLDSEMDALTAGLTSAKGQFFDSFSLSNNLGFVMPFLLAIILCKDFSFGTVRNKIISGHSRSRIFLSMYTVCAVVMWVVMLLHALLSLCISLFFFDYQSTPFTWEDFGYLMASLGFELLIYLFAAAFITWLCATMKNVGLVIVLYAAVTFGLSMIASILQVTVVFLELDPNNESTLQIIQFVQRINPINSSTIIGKVNAYGLTDILYLILVPVIGATGLLGLGLAKFNRRDLK